MATVDAEPSTADPAAGVAEPEVVSDADWRPPPDPPDRIYTAHNMWYESSDSMNTINYQIGKLLPAGTEVTEVVVIKRRFRKDTIEFSTPGDGVHFRISWDANNHVGWTLDQIRERMFSGRDFEQLTQGLSPIELENIRRGTLQVGMGRRAVLVSFGYPPAVSTPELDLALWKYWIRPARLVTVRFDRSGRTVAGPVVKE